MSTEKTQALVAIALAKIRSGQLSQQELINYFVNVNGSPAVTDFQREQVAEAVESQLRHQFPARANKMFGKADAGARAMLVVLLDKIEKKFDLSQNRVKSTVKTGGDQLRGEFVLDVYISYKNAAGRRASFEIRQVDRDSFKLIAVRVHDVPSNTGVSFDEFELSNFDLAVVRYEEALAELIGLPADMA